MDPPAPSILQRYLLEQPWPLVVVLLLIAVACLLGMLRRRDKTARHRFLIVSSIAAGLAAGVLLLATAVRTDREAIEQTTRELVAAAGPLDPDRLDALIFPDAVFTGPDGSVWRTWDESEPAIRAGSRWVEFKESPHTIRSLRVGVLPSGEGVTLMDVRTDVPGAAFFKTKWRLTWRKDAEGEWRMHEARWLDFFGRQPTPDMLP